jgi:hypothetical protein
MEEHPDIVPTAPKPKPILVEINLRLAMSVEQVLQEHGAKEI